MAFTAVSLAQRPALPTTYGRPLRGNAACDTRLKAVSPRKLVTKLARISRLNGNIPVTGVNISVEPVGPEYFGHRVQAN